MLKHVTVSEKEEPCVRPRVINKDHRRTRQVRVVS